ncbi:MAG: ABC transporter ATP-binding protein [Betaproteobacteria bacterium]|nr:ABC transporter ATP-binding protein [Betaproteobacteria bacterium]
MIPALEISDLNKAFGGVSATSGVEMRVMPGARHLIIGPNGAGKTTLFNLISGDLYGDSGSIRLFGREVSRLPPHRRAHLGLARTYQIITLFGEESLEHNLVLSQLGLSPLRWRPFAPLDRFGELRQEARAVLARVNLDHLAERRLGELSYGERRRAEMAMALAQRPRLLLLDEPFAGLSREERTVLKDLIAGVPREVTIILIEHDMDIALELAERITVLHYGKVIVDGTRAEVVADPRTREVYLGD